MGIDFLDLEIRVQKAFGIDHPRPHLYQTREQYSQGQFPTHDPTVAELHDNLREFLDAHRLPVPPDSWERLQRCIAQTLAIPPQSIRPDHHLKEDLGAT